jgi:hypothetical protein
MNDEISLRNEELRYIRNDTIELDKETMMIRDDIKKLNKGSTDTKVNCFFNKLERKR